MGNPNIDKMTRFLTSIGIENIEDYDMSFDLCSRNSIKREILDMIILKKTPWKYHLLRKFQDGLQTINYKYTLAFSYLERPTVENTIELFNDWYQSLYRLRCNITMKDDKGKLAVIYKDEDEKVNFCGVISDFKDFLSFIYYNIQVVERVENNKDNGILFTSVEEAERESKLTKQGKIVVETKSQFETKSAAEENPNDEEVHEVISAEEENEIKDAPITFEESSSHIEYEPMEKEDDEEIEDDEDIIEKDHKKDQEIVEQELLIRAKQNHEQMLRDREMSRRNKKGNYQVVDRIEDLDTNYDNVDIESHIFSVEENAFNKDRIKYTYGINDEMGGAIYVVMYTNSFFTKDKAKELKKGVKARVRGCVYLDEYTHQLMLKGHYIDILPPDLIEEDKAPVKRVELHLHSQMSAMDATGSMMDYATYAKALGMKALSIADHGVVYGFPDAQKAAKKTGLKMLYGCEFYMVDDELQYINNPSNIELSHANYVVFDLETTGLSCRYNRITEFGAVRIEKGVEVARLDILMNPGCKIPDKIVKLTHITNELVADKPLFKDVKEQIKAFCKDAILVSHNAGFDVPFLNESLLREGDEILTNPVIDTLSLSRYLFPNNRNHRLGTLCHNFEVKYDPDVAHRADYDASVLNECWQVMLVNLIKENPHYKHEDLGKLVSPIESLKHIHPYHMIAYATNYDGLHDMYRLVTKAHIDYLAEVPKIPRSEVQKLRKNLLIGSACFNSDVFENASHKNLETLRKTIEFYDYIEIQPFGNYLPLINTGDFESFDDVKNILTDIVNMADELGKPVVATGDVHYCFKKDKIFRDVYISAKGLGGAYHPLNLDPYGRKGLGNYENPDQYFLSTDEMLAEMAWLGEEKAYEVTVANTNMIADKCEVMVPLPNDVLYTPTIDNCENMLSDLCFGNAKKLYGDPLPEYIKKRLDTELHGIISNGFSVIYWIAHKLVKKANEDGYLVGSRGSVGSSFVATMADITEVNPLPPHYRCPHCKHLEWTTETLPDIKSGYDLPEKRCPVCGEIMIGDGQDIPFETFLGFHAEKTPDIDLNFPGDYQSRAHDYTKVLLGENNVFRAGTIETVAEKTAYGYARGYFERMGADVDSIPRAKIAYLASGCVDVRRTTGQHPGGIVVVPEEYEVYDFTPVQFPANKPDSAWKTTHFDFRSMHDTILKLDLLGHVDPVALKMMADLTGIDIKSIPLNDPEVMSIFSSPDALKMHSNHMNQTTGALAIPEFGTNFVRGMLEQTRPKSFSDLVIISGLSHGTDVWNGNAEMLIQKGITDLRGVIGCRDDIMVYLISMHLPAEKAFVIMEDVRHGFGLKEEYVQLMLAHNVPQYYIDSCNKIQYMFPKGHATAYVMMAIRVGYFKVRHPLEFYATFFSVRCDQWELNTMIAGEDAIVARLDELNARNRNKATKLSPKEDAILKTLQVALEMVQRGFKFKKVDLYKSLAAQFVVDHEDNALIAPFTVLDGLGEAAAESVVEARKDHEFTSKEDLTKRTKLNNTNVKDLSDLGSLDGLSDTDQLSLFDFM